MVFLLILAVGCVLGYLVADSVVPQHGPSSTRGKAMGFIFWPIAGGVFVLDFVVLIVLMKISTRLFGLKHTNDALFPEVKKLRGEGYRYGAAPKK
jgi:hypothetical protein